MTRSDDERLDDMRDACAEVAELVDRGEDAYIGDRAVALAIERLLEIIGEAANALDPSTRERFPDVAWSDIARLRIVLAHHYHRVDSDQVWAIASDDVPRLAEHLGASGS